MASKEGGVCTRNRMVSTHHPSLQNVNEMGVGAHAQRVGACAPIQLSHFVRPLLPSYFFYAPLCGGRLISA